MYTFGKIHRPYGDRLHPGNGMLWMVDGGTSSYDYNTFIKKLNTCVRGMIDAPYGIAGIGPDGYLNFDVMAEYDLRKTYPTIYAVTQYGWANVNQVIEMYVYDYSKDVEYTVSTDNGDITIVDDRITFTAPSYECVATITLNKSKFIYKVLDNEIKTPKIVSHHYGQTGCTNAQVFTSSQFEVFDPVVVDTYHVSSTWQLSTSEDFTPSSIIKQTIKDKVHTTYWLLDNLEYDKTYYIRVMYHDSNRVDSVWSPVIKFTTDAFVLDKPVIVTNPSDSIRLETACSSYRITSTGPTITDHVCTTWELATDNSFTNVVRKSVNDVVNKTKWVQRLLDFDTTYWLRCKQQNSLGEWTEWSDPVSFTTCSSYIPTPTITITTPSSSDDLVWPDIVNTFQLSVYDNTNKATRDTTHTKTYITIIRDMNNSVAYNTTLSGGTYTVSLPVNKLCWNNQPRGEHGKYTIKVRYEHNHPDRGNVVSSAESVKTFYTEDVVVKYPSISATINYTSLIVKGSKYDNTRIHNGITHTPSRDYEHSVADRLDGAYWEFDKGDADSDECSVNTSRITANLAGNEYVYSKTDTRFFTKAYTTSDTPKKLKVDIYHDSHFYNALGHSGHYPAIYKSEVKTLNLPLAGIITNPIRLLNKSWESITLTSGCTFIPSSNPYDGTYSYEWTISPNHGTKVITDSGTTTTCMFDGLTPDTPYYITLRHYNRWSKTYSNPRRYGEDYVDGRPGSGSGSSISTNRPVLTPTESASGSSNLAMPIFFTDYTTGYANKGRAVCGMLGGILVGEWFRSGDINITIRAYVDKNGQTIDCTTTPWTGSATNNTPIKYKVLHNQDVFEGLGIDWDSFGAGSSTEMAKGVYIKASIYYKGSLLNTYTCRSDAFACSIPVESGPSITLTRDNRSNTVVAKWSDTGGGKDFACSAWYFYGYYRDNNSKWRSFSKTGLARTRTGGQGSSHTTTITNVPVGTKSTWWFTVRNVHGTYSGTDGSNFNTVMYNYNF